jgi:hypothetical protein
MDRPVAVEPDPDPVLLVDAVRLPDGPIRRPSGAARSCAVSPRRRSAATFFAPSGSRTACLAAARVARIGSTASRVGRAGRTLRPAPSPTGLSDPADLVAALDVGETASDRLPDTPSERSGAFLRRLAGIVRSPSSPIRTPSCSSTPCGCPTGRRKSRRNASCYAEAKSARDAEELVRWGLAAAAAAMGRTA